METANGVLLACAPDVAERGSLLATCALEGGHRGLRGDKRGLAGAQLRSRTRQRSLARQQVALERCSLVLQPAVPLLKRRQRLLALPQLLRVEGWGSRVGGGWGLC